MFQTVEFGYYDANGDGKVERTNSSTSPTAPSRCSTNERMQADGEPDAGARAHSEQIFDSKKAQSGDPRETQKGGPGIGGM
jgi:hypothetical protein